MTEISLVITSIADQTHPVLRLFAESARLHGVRFIVVGDTKSPRQFHIDGCEFLSLEKQMNTGFELAGLLPTRHYARKNIGYLVAIRSGASVINESDDDNVPYDSFWDDRFPVMKARCISDGGWVNAYRYFCDAPIWPRGFSLEHVLDHVPEPSQVQTVVAPVQQGLVDDNPDVDAIYRMTLPLPVTFRKADSIALGARSICPFNSQNTTWFREAFPLLYLPSHCSFRMTDIWRSFVAQRIAWTCGWSILYRVSTARQERNEHRLLKDFEDEVPGYLHNGQIMDTLGKLNLKQGPENILDNLEHCYRALARSGFIAAEELPLVNAWIRDVA